MHKIDNDTLPTLVEATPIPNWSINTTTDYILAHHKHLEEEKLAQMVEGQPETQTTTWSTMDKNNISEVMRGKNLYEYHKTKKKSHNKSRLVSAH